MKGLSSSNLPEIMLLGDAFSGQLAEGNMLEEHSLSYLA
jgi:hypothetical protein